MGGLFAGLILMGSAKPKPDAAGKRALDAMATGNASTMKAVARELRSGGYEFLADQLEQKAAQLESLYPVR